MLERPEITDDAIIACLRDHYELTPKQIEFLPLGADRNTAVFKAHAANDEDYFVKLRSGEFNETSVVIPRMLHDQGITQVIAPLRNRRDHLWTPLESYRLILYPFIEGVDGWERELSAQNWIALGQALKQMHAVTPPADMPRESYSAFWRERVREFQASVETTSYSDPVSAELAGFIREKKAEISALVFHADRLASALEKRNLPFVICHADIHVGNVLVTPSDTLYIVDWDTLISAPKEHDLMFMGSGIAGQNTLTAAEQADWFYQGYGQAEVDTTAIAYYRCERIVQDAYAYCEQILFTSGNSADRAEGLRQFQSQFTPHAVVELALKSVTAFA